MALMIKMVEQFAKKLISMLDTDEGVKAYNKKCLSSNHLEKHHHGIEVETKWIGGNKCYIISNVRKKSNKAVLIIYGSGFLLETASFDYDFFIKIVKNTGVTLYAPMYPLSTPKKSAAKAQVTCLVKVYKEILNKFSAQNINVIGDSSGGNSALVLSQQLNKQKIATPNNLVCISPFVNLNLTDKDIKEAAQVDAITSEKFFKTMIRYHVQKDNPKNPIYSPIYGDVKNLAQKIYFFYGEREGSLQDGRKIYQLIKQAGGTIPMDVKPGMFHDYMLLLKDKESVKTTKTIFNILKS